MKWAETHTENAFVFSLNTGWWNFDESSDEPLRTPELGVYRSAADAAADNEGLSIVETLHGYDDLWFFAADGSPLEAHFSQEPYINFERNTYFRGVYSLHPGTGATLLEAIEKRVVSNEDRSPQARIVVWIAGTNEAVKEFGWSTPEIMKQSIKLALRILHPEMQKRLVFVKLPYNNEQFLNIEDAVGDH